MPPRDPGDDERHPCNKGVATAGSWKTRTKAVCIGVLTAIISASAQDLSTVEGDLARFWHKVESGTGPITVLSFGDSMAASYRSVSYYTMRKLEERFGAAGYALNNYGNKLMWSPANGASIVGPSSMWFTEHCRLPPGGSVWWEAEWQTGIYGNQVGVYLVAYPEGGAVTISISTNGGPWSQITQLSASSVTPTGLVFSTNVPLDIYRVRVDSASGTNFVIGAQVVDATARGIQIAFMDQPGIPLSYVESVPRAIRDPVLAALRPDLTIWHMKEDGSLNTSNYLVGCEEWWRSVNPDGDVIYIGTPWTVNDTPESPFTLGQNTLVRSIAVANSRSYCDLMQRSVNLTWLQTNGFIFPDGVHLSDLGAQWGADLLWSDFGFFALGTPRQLRIANVNGQAQVSYQTATNLNYTLLHSADLVNWSVQTNVTGDGLIRTHAFPFESEHSFFKLRISE